MTRTRATAGTGTPAAAVSDGNGSEPSVPAKRRGKREDDGYYAMVPAELLRSSLSDAALRTWAALDNKANVSTIAMVSQPELAELTGKSESAVRRHLKELLCTPWLTQLREGKGHGRAHYRVNNPARRRAVTGDHPTNDTDEHPESSFATDEEAVEQPDSTALLESFQESGLECAIEPPANLALFLKMDPRLTFVDTEGNELPDEPRCHRCGTPTREGCGCPF